ncbi:MAG TPA: helix-turn-helix domain-containing protein [Luteimonas sp.]|nr:helix-turn-helix domain-containing protein [Luteimonas sp.]
MSRDKNAPAGACRRPARTSPLADCPLAAAFAAIGGKWKLTIVYWLAHDEHHFSGLLRRVAPISHKVLTEQLRELEADGLVERLSSGPVPAPVHYRLSPYGGTLLTLVESVRLWGLAHLRRNGPSAGTAPSLPCAAPVPAAPAAVDARPQPAAERSLA